MFNCSPPMNSTDGAMRVFARVAYTPVFIVSLTFNITTLCIFSRIKIWTDTHIYMLNLLLADFLAIVFLPFRIFEAFCPLEKSRLCTVLLCTQFSNMYSSILTITAISVHRFVAIKFPFLAKTLLSRSKSIATVACLLIWVFITVVCAIFHRDLLPQNLQTCYNRRLSVKLNRTFLYMLEIFGFLVPLSIVMLCSTQTVHALVKSLRQMKGPRRTDRRNIIAIIVANALIFLVCFTPVHAGILLQYLSNESDENFVYVFLDVAEWLATTNCCLDSVGYYFLLRRARKTTKDSF